MFKKPQVVLEQRITTTPTISTSQMPTILLGAKYDVFENYFIGEYVNNLDTTYSYNTIHSVSTEFTKLYMINAVLKYYDSSHVWKKLGTSSNKIRTILSDGLIFKSTTLYPHSSIFSTRGVRIGDYVRINNGIQVVEAKVAGYEADMSTSSIDAVIPSTGNKQTTAGSIGAATAGAANSGTVNVTSNTGGTYTGSLYNNTIEEIYTIKVIETGTTPTNLVASNSHGTIIPTLNSIYDFSSSEVYVVTITLGGAPGTAKFVATSQSGMDNQAETTTPAIGAPSGVALGTRGVVFELTGSGTYSIGDIFTVSCTPSTAKVMISSASYSEVRVFPGFGYTFPLRYGVTASFGLLTTPTLNVNDYWTISAKKAIDAVVCSSSGTFSGMQDINYVLEVIQGGEYGQAVVRINSTYLDNGKLVTVPVSRVINIGDFNVIGTFSTNTQNGLVKGDKFSISCKASKETAFKTLILDTSLPVDSTTIGSTSYTGSGSPHNTGLASGTFSPTYKALHLYNQEVYTIIISTDGDYGTAKFIVTTASGLDNNLTETVVPVTEGELVSIGSYGLKFAFTGSELFSTSDRWSVTVTKTSLDVTLGINIPNFEVQRLREEDNTQTAWSTTNTNITVNSAIKHYITDWNYLPVYKSHLYLTYKALNNTGAEEVYSISSSNDITTKLGEVHPQNIIAQAAELALLNAGNTQVFACYPKTDDVDGWSSMLSKLELRERSNVYRLAVQSFNTAIIDAVVSHITKMEERNKWRVAYICREIEDSVKIVEEQATIEEDLANLGQYTIMRGTDFSLCRPGDIVTYLNNTFTIVSVITPTEIKLDTSFGSPQTVPSTAVVTRVLSEDEIAQYYVYYNQRYKNRRIISIAPDSFTYNNSILPGYFLTAIVAGLKSGLVPHQSLTNYSVGGVTDINTYKEFTETQLDTMANGGTMIITKDSMESTPYIRHQVTTSTDFVKYREISVTENVDNICYDIVEECKKFIGKYNLHTGIISQIRTNIEGILFSKTQNVSVQAGPQVIAYEVLKFQQSPVSEDTLEIELKLTVSTPLNYIYVTLTV